MLCGPFFTGLPFIFLFLPISVLLPVDEWACGRRRGLSAVPSSGVPAASLPCLAWLVPVLAAVVGALLRPLLLLPLLPRLWPSRFLGTIFWHWYGMSSHG